MSPPLAGSLGVLLSLILVILGVPIAFAFAITGLVGFIYLVGFEPGLLLLSIHPYSWASSYTLMPVPLFIFMSAILGQVGITGDLFNTAAKWTARLPGSLAMSSVIACTGFAAICGSSVASAAAMGMACIPEMRKYGVNARLATGVIASGGTLGILIPPSLTFILLGVLTEVSIGKLFLAGILPGLMISFFLLCAVYVRVKLNPQLAPAIPSSTWNDKISSLKKVIEVPFLFGVIMGGIYAGLFTPTESGAIGAFVAILMAFRRKRLTWKALTHSLSETSGLAAMTVTIVIGAMIFQSFLAASRLPAMLSTWVSNLNVSSLLILIIIMFIYIILGCLMEVMAMVVLTVPILFPVIVAAGINPVHFCVLIVLTMEIGMITPPVGINVFVIKGLIPNVSLEDIFQGIWPFLLALIIGLVLLVLFPQISLFIPNQMM